MSAVVRMTVENHNEFLRQFDQLATNTTESETIYSHVRVFKGPLRANITNQIDSDWLTYTLTTRPSAPEKGSVAYVRLLHVEETSHRLNTDLLGRIGIDPEHVLDLFTGQVLADWQEPSVPYEMRGGFSSWVETAPPSALILVRCKTEEKAVLGSSVLRCVPPAIRRLLPIILVTDVVADAIDEIFADQGLGRLSYGTVSILTNTDQQMNERYRTSLSKTTERALSSAISAMLEETAEELEEISAFGALLPGGAPEIDGLSARLEAKEIEEKTRLVELHRAENEARRARRMVRQLEYELQEIRRSQDPDVEGSSEEVPAPETDKLIVVDPIDPWDHLPPLEAETFAEMLTQAREAFPRVVIDLSIEKRVQPLENHAKRDIWLSRSWMCFALLNEYANAKNAGDDAGSFRAWVESQPPSTIQPSHVRSSETELMRSGKYGEARTFSVPMSIDPSGRAQFLTHIHIETGKVNPNPRMHFLDGTYAGGTGQVYVGHLGPHLTTRRSN